MIISKEYYELLDFSFPKIKYLTIDYESLKGPVNSFIDDDWMFNKNLEDTISLEKVTLESYTLFKFLLHSNLIYSLKEIEIIGEFKLNWMKKDLYYLVETYNIETNIKFVQENHYSDYFNLEEKESDDELSIEDKEFILSNRNNKNSESILDCIYADTDHKMNNDEIIYKLNSFMNNQNEKINIDLDFLLFTSPYKLSLFEYDDILFDFEIELIENDIKVLKNY